MLFGKTFQEYLAWKYYMKTSYVIRVSTVLKKGIPQVYSIISIAPIINI